MKKQEKAELIYSHLPISAERVIAQNPQQHQAVRRIVKRIYQDYGVDLRALAKH
jgi:uncharacterized protein YpuA (DUF1002 family)